MLGNATNTWNWSRISGLSAVAALGAGALAALRGSRTRQGAPDAAVAAAAPDHGGNCIDGWCPPDMPTPMSTTLDEGTS